MASPTLTNSPKLDQLLANIPQLSLRPSPSKSQRNFLVFPTGGTEYHWRVADVATNRTISQHKSLTCALGKCVWLNKQRGRSQVQRGRRPLRGHKAIVLE